MHFQRAGYILRNLVGVFTCLVLLVSALSVRAQLNIPPVPDYALNLPILYPNVIAAGVINDTTPTTQYTLLVNTGDNFTITVRRTNGNFLPTLELFTTTQQSLEKRSANLAGTQSVLTYQATQTQWLVIQLAREGNAANGVGDYELLLSGSTQDIFTILPNGPPPNADRSAGIIAQRGHYYIELPEGQPSVKYLIPVQTQMSVSIDFTAQSQLECVLQNIPGTQLAACSGSSEKTSLTYTAELDGWLILIITPAQAVKITAAVQFKDSSGSATSALAVYATEVIQYIPPTSTPSPTATATISPTIPTIPTSTPTLRQTETLSNVDNYPKDCGKDTLETQIQPNQRVTVIAEQDLFIRPYPTASAPILRPNPSSTDDFIRLKQGTHLFTTDVPQCAYYEGNRNKRYLMWWPVKVLDGEWAGLTGWVSESGLNKYGSMAYNVQPE
jgi:hypothetical protein